jgi:hypothetical protein
VEADRAGIAGLRLSARSTPNVTFLARGYRDLVEAEASIGQFIEEVTTANGCIRRWPTWRRLCSRQIHLRGGGGGGGGPPPPPPPPPAADTICV